MTLLYKYKIFCITENNFQFIWDTIPPTSCPTNAIHTVNASSVHNVKIIDTYRHSTTNVTADGNNFYRLEPNGNNITFVLPDMVNNQNRIIIIQRLLTNINTVTIVVSNVATDTINNAGTSTTLITNKQTIKLKAVNTNWQLLTIKSAEGENDILTEGNIIRDNTLLDPNNNNYYLGYNNTTKKYEARQIIFSEIGGTVANIALHDLSNVNAPVNPNDNKQYVGWNTTQSKWINKQINITDINGTANNIPIGNGTNGMNQIKYNLSAITAPTESSDSSAGYSIGSRWIDTVNSREFICLNSSINSSIWKETSGGSSSNGVFSSVFEFRNDILVPTNGQIIFLNNSNINQSSIVTTTKIRISKYDINLLLVSILSTLINDKLIIRRQGTGLLLNDSIQTFTITSLATDVSTYYEITSISNLVLTGTSLINKERVILDYSPKTTLSTLTDTNITSASTGQYLIYNNNKWTNTIKSEFAQTRAPRITDDSTLGYTIGSRWLDLSTNREYVCMSSTVSNATWISGSAGSLNELSDVFIRNVSTYNTFNTFYNPTARWIPTGIGGSAGAYNWIESISNASSVLSQSTTTSPLTTIGGITAINISDSNWISFNIQNIKLNNVNYNNNTGCAFYMVYQNFQQGAVQLYDRLISAINSIAQADNNDSRNFYLSTESTGETLRIQSNATVLNNSYNLVTSSNNTPTIMFLKFTATTLKIWFNNILIIDSISSIFANVDINYFGFGKSIGTNNTGQSALRISEFGWWNSLIDDTTIINMSNVIGNYYGINTFPITLTNKQYIGYDGTQWINRQILTNEINGTTSHIPIGNDSGGMNEIKYNLTSNATPSTINDSSQGYSIGSRWIDIIKKKEYLCVDNTLATAIWKNTSIGGNINPNDATKFLRWDTITGEWLDDFIRIKQDSYKNVNLTKQTGQIFKESTNDNLLLYTGTSWKHIPVRDITFDDNYNNININFLPTVRWLPTSITGSIGLLTWNSTIGTGVINTQGSSLNYINNGISTKRAIYCNSTSANDTTNSLILDLGTTYTGSFTILFVIQDCASLGNNTRFITLLDTTPTIGNDYNNTTNIAALYKQGATTDLASLFNNSVISFLTTTNFNTIDTTPTVIIMRYNTTNTEWCVWLNKTNDTIITTNTVNLNTLQLRMIGFNYYNGVTTEAGKIKLSEVIFWNSALTDTRIQSLSDAILVEYAVRTTPSYPTYPNKLEQLTNVNISNPQVNDVIKYNGTNWVNSTSDSVSVWLFSDTKTLGTVGGSANINIYTTRILNTTNLSSGADAYILNNQLIISNGNWSIEIQSTFYNTDETKLRLYNITDNINIISSLNYLITNNTSISLLTALSLNSPKTFEIQYYASANNGSTDLGFPSGIDTEIYTYVKLTKITNTLQYWIITDDKTTGSVGGNAIVNTWTRRDINTIKAGSGNGVIISNNQLIISLGTYTVDIQVPFFNTDQTRLRLRNITDNTTQILSYSQNVINNTYISLNTHLTLTGTNTFEIQYYATTNSGQTALGIPDGIETSETFTMIRIIKL